MSASRKNLALVMSGGGARGAYEAGVLHYVRTMMERESCHNRQFDIICGSSVGAINAVFLAATAHDLKYQGNKLYQLWRDIRQERVYRRGLSSLAQLTTRSITGITRNLFSKVDDEDVGPIHKKHFKGLLDTSPLIPFLKDNVPWGQISLNIQNELIRAVSLTATNAHTGKLELFVEKHPSVVYSGRYILHDTKLEYIHAMASAALPIIFESVQIGKRFYIDGGLRLNTPMSPAIQLGADKLLVVGMHHIQESSEEEDGLDKPFLQLNEPPSIGLLLGKILAAMFLDRLEYDLEQLERINRIIEWGEGAFGAAFLDQINDYVYKARIRGDIANRGLKRLQAFRIFPSRDLRDVFAECVEGSQFFTKGLTALERTLLKLLDVNLHSGKDFLSFIMFVPEFLQRLLELGFEDARRQHDQIAAFLSDDT